MDAGPAFAPNPLRIRSLHRLTHTARRFQSFTVTCGLYYGLTATVGLVEVPDGAVQSGAIFPMVAWTDGKCEFDVSISHLPRETRVCFTVLGRMDERQAPEVVGWVATPLFDFSGVLSSGDVLMGLWPGAAPRTTGNCDSNVFADDSPLLFVSMPEFEGSVKYNTAWRKLLEAPAPAPGSPALEKKSPKLRLKSRSFSSSLFIFGLLALC